MNTANCMYTPLPPCAQQVPALGTDNALVRLVVSTSTLPCCLPCPSAFYGGCAKEKGGLGDERRRKAGTEEANWGLGFRHSGSLGDDAKGVIQQREEKCTHEGNGNLETTSSTPKRRPVRLGGSHLPRSQPFSPRTHRRTVRSEA